MINKLAMKILAIVFFCQPFMTVAEPASNEQQYREQIEELARAYQSVYGFSGSIKVVKGGLPIVESSYGLADRSFNIDNAIDYRFSINSISKTFTATAVMQLVELGEINLNQSVGSYLPELNADWKDEVTVHHLLTHSSGLPRESGIQWYDELTLEQQVVNLINKQTLLFAPGTRYEYSNSGITLLGRIIETVSGQSFSNYINNQIIKPLELTNTGVYEGRKLVKKQAVPYRITTNGVASAQRAKHLGQNAGGGMYSTVNDLYQFVVALENNRLFSAETTQLMFKPQIQIDGGDAASYGWTLKPFGDKTLVFASGSGYGTKSVMVRESTSGDFIAVTSNWGNTPILQLMAGLFLIINDLDYDLPDQKALAQPNDYVEFLGTYRFDPSLLKKHLMTDSDSMTLQEIDGLLFLNDELLADKQNGFLGLTYTDEVMIKVDTKSMTININGNQVIGKRQD
ncbi:serine hydrolase domain-containing protein [Pseudidiomarina aestuarii]|uniref:serine hydrolase domain-containing protein n=1 Tax=Pseudidiomarina aestuarii TaxID=624146 RepID=UPI003A97E3DC